MPTRRRLLRDHPPGVVADFQRALRHLFGPTRPARGRPPVCRLCLEELEARIQPSGLHLTTTEAGGTARFTVVLTSQPTADVIVPLSSSNTLAGTLSATS